MHIRIEEQSRQYNENPAGNSNFNLVVGKAYKSWHSKPTKKFNNNNVRTNFGEEFKKKRGYCSDSLYVINVKNSMKLVCILCYIILSVSTWIVD